MQGVSLYAHSGLYESLFLRPAGVSLEGVLLRRPFSAVGQGGDGPDRKARLPSLPSTRVAILGCLLAVAIGAVPSCLRPLRTREEGIFQKQ